MGVRIANVPWMATALKRCIVNDSRLKRNAHSRESSDSSKMRLPSSTLLLLLLLLFSGAVRTVSLSAGLSRGTVGTAPFRVSVSQHVEHLGKCHFGAKF